MRKQIDTTRWRRPVADRRFSTPQGEKFLAAVTAAIKNKGVTESLVIPVAKILFSNSRVMVRDNGKLIFIDNPHVGGVNIQQLGETIGRMNVGHYYE